MATNYVSDGEIMDYTAAATLAVGVGVLIGARLGVTLVAIANGATGSVAMEGVWTLPKLSTDVVAQGALLYWDNTNSRLTVTATGNTLAGYAMLAAGSGVTTVRIKINA